MSVPFRHGSCLYLRPLDLADAPLLQRWINDPEITRFLARTRPWMLHRGRGLDPEAR